VQTLTLTLADVDQLTHSRRPGWPVVELAFPVDVATPALLAPRRTTQKIGRPRTIGAR